MLRRTTPVWTALVLLLGLAQPALADTPGADPDQVVRDAMSDAGGIPQQADALAALAWPDGERDEAVAEAARAKLQGFGRHALPTLRRAIGEVRREHQHEVVGVMIRAFRSKHGMNPADYVVALDEALWFGTRETRELVIPELARFGNPNLLLPIIDAAVEEPELLPVALRALSRLRDPRARFFLNDLLHHNGEYRDEAARILGQTGGLAGVPLRDALLSTDREIRLAAVRGLLPHATVDDLTALYDYYGTFPDDDSETMEQVRQTALRLEQLLQAKREADSASPTPDR